MITYDSFLRTVKIRSVTGQRYNSLIEFLISVRDNGSYVLRGKFLDSKQDVDEYHYEYRYNDIVVFSFKYKYSSYDANVSEYFISIYEKKYGEVYKDGNEKLSVKLFQQYIIDFLGYGKFSPKISKIVNG